MNLINKYGDKLWPYFINFLITIAISLFLYLSERQGNHFLFTPLMFLPYIWIGFGLSSIYIFCLQLFRANKNFISISSVFMLFVLSYFSMFVIFYVDDLVTTNTTRIEIANESAQCLQNYKKLKNLYDISNLTIKPSYDQANKVNSFTISFLLSSLEDLSLTVSSEIYINGKNPFFSSSSYQKYISMIKNSPKTITFKLDKVHQPIIDDIRKMSGDANVAVSISILDDSHKKPQVIFLPERPNQKKLCGQDLRNAWIEPIYEAPELKISGYKISDF